MFDICITLSKQPLLANQWSYVLSHWNIGNIYLIGENNYSDLHHLRDGIPINNAEELPNKELIVLAPKDGRYVKGNESLVTFSHPKECIYLFGPDHTQLSEELGKNKPTHTVYIPTDSKHEMYAHVCAAVTLYDRKLKEKYNG